jgi:predicted phage terminase large subunit-like protein
MMKVSAQDKRYLRDLLRMELARRDLWQFCLFYDPDFFRDRAFLKDVAVSLQEIEEGKIRSLSVSMPPRAGKSYITSLYCAWTLGRNPSESIMRNTCTASLYVKFSYDVRAIIMSDKYRTVFPSVRLSDDKKNLQGWNTNSSRQVGYFGAGVGGTIIGFGATKVAITDDLYRGIEDAMSDTVNDRIHQWKQSTHDSRFETGCARVDIGTRWSLNDVIGRNMQEGQYDKSIIIPALKDDGTSFCEAVMTTAEFQEKRKRTSPEIWSAEYMQEPVDIKGRLFSELQFIDEVEFQELVAKRGIDGAVAYIDVADQGADYTAMAVAVIVNNAYYLAELIYTKDNTDITLPLCASVLNKWNATYCRVESNSMGAMFARQLQHLTSCRILQVANQVNKNTRIIMQSVYIQQRLNFVRREHDAQALQFIDNVLSYSKEGKNKHDDAPDCLAGLSLFLQSMFKNQ